MNSKSPPAGGTQPQATGAAGSNLLGALSLLFPFFQSFPGEGHWVRGGLPGKERRRDSWRAGPRSEDGCSLLLTSGELLGMAPRNSSPKLVSTPTP